MSTAGSKSTTCPTIGDYVRFLTKSSTGGANPPDWPPDVFALAAALLHKSGAYTRVVSRWPPSEFEKSPESWVEHLYRIGDKWKAAIAANERPPTEVVDWWKTVMDNKSMTLAEMRGNETVCEALIQLCAAADEASENLGIPDEFGEGETVASVSTLVQEDSERNSEIEESTHSQKGIDPINQADIMLRPQEGGSSLCVGIHRTRLRVLPKLHTPQSGITIRSLSHHLALCSSEDVEVSWYKVAGRPETKSFNILLLPWPETVIPAQFNEVKGSLANLPKRFGFFKYNHAASAVVIQEKFERVLHDAEKIIGRVDGVVFPEMALSKADYELIKTRVLEKNAFLVCGVGEEGAEGEPARNYLAIDVGISKEHYLHHVQDKHHRWRLDQRQVIQYGLAGTLDPNRFWWENISLGTRSLGFFAMTSSLTLCALVCEDLARQDPVAEIVRAVGPNLVIAILMDGPQLASRWPARYATVLADDPGSSVLTLTSLGMAKLSRPLDKQYPSNIVAMWKDAKSGSPVEISLPNDSDGLVLTLAVEKTEEWTADGRTDFGSSGNPILSGIHPIPRR